MAGALARLAADRALVVSSADGLDELSTAGATHVVEVDAGAISRYDVTPEEVGLAPAIHADVAGGPPGANAQTTRRILAGTPGPQRDLAVFNAGAAIYAAGRAGDLATGARAAEAAIDSGAAAEALDRLVGLTARLAPS